MAYLYRIELDGYGIFTHPIVASHLTDNMMKWHKHIRDVEPIGEVMGLLVDANMTHYDGMFGCRSLDDLVYYLGEFLVDTAIDYGFVVVRYTVPDAMVYDGENQSLCSRKYRKTGRKLGTLYELMSKEVAA